MALGLTKGHIEHKQPKYPEILVPSMGQAPETVDTTIPTMQVIHVFH